ncbi:MAG: single-stranded DNA-binding protein [Coriobacteriia bacterium]|nr:single-stranded DNA-binding protein [Coriobacteriia bacterium]
MSINKVMITGNLTRDPELRATGSGMQILQFGVAVNDRRRNQQTGEWEDYPNFVDCVVFGSRAEALSRFLSKGSKVAVEGKLRYSSWEAKEGGRRSKLEVIVDDLDFLSQRGGQQGGSQGQGGYAAQAPQQYSQVNQGYQASAPAYAAPAPAARPVQTPPPADVYDEDIPF